MASATRIVEALGGRKALRGGVRSLSDLRERVQDGLPYGSFEALAASYGLDKARLVQVLGVPARTLARRRQQARFASEESDRLVRLARVAALAEDVLGERAKAGRWLQKPNRALSGAAPLDRLDTDLGTREVEDILGRIAHGIPS